MTQVTANTTTQQTSADVSANATTPPTPTFNESLSQVLTKLSGQKVKPDQLVNAKYNEQVLYAAHVLDQLKKTSPELAKTFLSEVKTRYDRRITRNDTNALGKAINDILDNGVKKKQISSSQYNRIMGNALGKAQLDSKKSDVNSALKKGGSESINTKTAANKKATSTELKEYENTVSTLKFQSKKVTAQQQKRMQELFDSLKTKAATQPKEPQITDTTKTPGDETSTEVPPNDPTRETGPNSFDFRPKSDTNGKLHIKIPAAWSSESVRIELISRTGEVLDKSTDNKIGTDGRRHYNFSKPGSDYEGLSKIRIILTDGTWIDKSVSDRTKPFSDSYLG
jgi:hypothetical protein